MKKELDRSKEEVMT